MARLPAVMAIGLILATPPGLAEIYKHVDKNGRVTYSNTPIPGAQKLELKPLTTIEPPQIPPPAESKADPRVAQLKEALAQEVKKLEAARKTLEEERQRPETFRTPSGGIGRAVARYEEKIQRLTEEVARYERNVEALKRELEALAPEAAAGQSPARREGR
ncbi:MAG: DUF4124 domain-containing protein [Azospira oryzae]|uniref:DUF4124 domain-containing protein n=2 Tax=Pelomicrobium methylotrophicum TaxID=2602750 RepID=A0A5C7EY16_9PROT|nr:MAG: DUF4124 domain-containing protein [Azospira oryzae]PZP78196.1 MAG: DUF4124 domain-containing protein [Azospira oryzae]TXF13392.1 DUF4124 domain-containing protein [Pelomicrobium methylotrophicum]